VIEWLGLVAAVALPFFNIPLIITMHRRQSSRDISLTWALGVWVCFVLMLPAGLTSSDVTFKVFSIVNMMLFTVVVIQVVRFRI